MKMICIRKPDDQFKEEIKKLLADKLSRGSVEEELKRLREENSRLRMENEDLRWIISPIKY